jgi:hypothetical protein
MSFDQLKREATNLERQLEDKLARYQQVRRYISRPIEEQGNMNESVSLFNRSSRCL